MSPKAQEIQVEALCNVHCHLREGDDIVRDLVQLAIEGGADVLGPMPNTNKGLITALEVSAYNKNVEFLSGGRIKCMPILMVNETTPLLHISACVEKGICSCKIYPLERTTKSHLGVRNYARLLPIIKHCAALGMKVHFHPEHPCMLFDNRDAEFAFLPIIDMFLHETDATLIWEHGTDARCIPFWMEMAKSVRFFVTLTAHHLCADEDSTFGDVRATCKPPIKTRRDKADLIRLVESDYTWVMAGLDDAPHDKKTKHLSTGRCSCGAYTAPFGLPLYAHALDNLLAKPEGVKTFVNFTSRNARKLHCLSPSLRTIKLCREPFHIPSSYKIGSWEVEPFWAAQTIDWRIAN